MKKKVIIAIVAVVIVAGIIAAVLIIGDQHKYADSNPVDLATKTQSNTLIGGTLKVSNETASLGGTVDVTVSVKDNPGILGMTLKVNYMTDVLTLIDAKNGEALKDVLTFTKPGSLQNNCKFLWDGMEISEDQIKDGDVLVLTFKVDENAKPGEYPILLSYSNDDIVDSNLRFIDLDIVDGSVTIE